MIFFGLCLTLMCGGYWLYDRTGRLAFAVASVIGMGMRASVVA